MYIIYFLKLKILHYNLIINILFVFIYFIFLFINLFIYYDLRIIYDIY